MMVQNLRSENMARAYHASSEQDDHCDPVRNGLQLPYHERIGLRKMK